MSAGRRDRLKTQGDMVGIGESSVDYSGSMHNNSVSRDQPAITSSLADVEAMLKMNNVTGDGNFGASNS